MSAAVLLKRFERRKATNEEEMKSLDLQHVRKRCPLPYLSNVYKVLSDVFDFETKNVSDGKEETGSYP